MRRPENGRKRRKNEFALQIYLAARIDNNLSTVNGLSFADDRLGVVAADVVELDAVVVEVVQDAQAELVALAVVRLGNAAAAKVN
jgi:hypothetical protein